MKIEWNDIVKERFEKVTLYMLSTEGNAHFWSSIGTNATNGYLQRGYRFLSIPTTAEKGEPTGNWSYWAKVIDKYNKGSFLQQNIGDTVLNTMVAMVRNCIV